MRFFFPAIFVMVDRLLLSNHQEMYLTLKQVKLLPRDVIGLSFEVPQGFVYQARRRSGSRSRKKGPKQRRRAS
ncbi:unnamed protein product [Effrenium voratum]|nr:unnamed protein product [Effrenium voratum]